MDKQKLDELKKEAIVDNSRLEELIKQDITPQMQKEVFEELRKSRLFLPVDFGQDAFKGIEDTKPGDEIEGPKGFNIQFLTDDDGNKAVPLFTSPEMMEKAGARTSVIVMYMSDLADMLRQTDRYSVIAINPFTEFDLNMPIGAFLAQFDGDKLEITDIKNDRVRELLAKRDLSDDELNRELLSSIMIVGCVDAEGGKSFVLIWNNENKPYLPLFTDLDEFKKIFANHREDVYPDAYHFKDLISVAKEDLVINPASESFEFSPETFRRR